ncbi:nuclear transport factor 2 family protein [Cryobacterium sp. Hh11]|uniref:nuclear transport factor 2 family protein n=1 Tax=Cryobacterium sp. Hh11 TaxID=2555868 RepID=UPI00106D444A|nr:nuclear transport factor 2 family protein [Cryobacterium sp. Hh11]TFD52610.1 nuclear transport factor 2 family protein [Cryobacterium sp. Hh11]
MNIDPATVVNIERERLRALVERDMAVAERLHAPDYQLVTPNGSTRTKSTYLSDVESKRLEYLVFEPESEISVKSSGNLMILRYIARIVLSVGIADELEFRAWHTDVYEHQDGHWMVCWSQATTIAP